MRFLFLLHGDDDGERQLAPEARRAIVDEHITFAGKLREQGKHVLGEALAGQGAAVVRPGNPPLVTDGPFATTRETIGGFYVVECASRDEAIALAARVPRSPGLAVEVLQIAEV